MEENSNSMYIRLSNFCMCNIVDYPTMIIHIQRFENLIYIELEFFSILYFQETLRDCVSYMLDSAPHKSHFKTFQKNKFCFLKNIIIPHVLYRYVRRIIWAVSGHFFIYSFHSVTSQIQVKRVTIIHAFYAFFQKESRMYDSY